MIATKKIAEEFRKWLVLDNVTDSTRDNYYWTIRLHCINKELKHINSRVFLLDIVEKMKRESKSLNTISRHVFGLKKFIRFIREMYGLPVTFDLNYIKCKHPRAGNPTYLKIEEIEKIRRVPCETFKDFRAHALFEFLLDTFCRISEVLKVKLEDIDFINRKIVVLGKGQKYRTVYYSNSENILSKYCRLRTDSLPWLFVSNNRKANHKGIGCLRKWYAERDIRLLGETAGLDKKITPHILRKTAITHLMKIGVNPRTVQEMAGHDDIDTTLKYYTSVDEEMKVSAWEKLSKLYKKV